jgi:ABC-type sugar transport system ATPase subunit
MGVEGVPSRYREEKSLLWWAKMAQGKSTLKNILCGLVAPDVGSIVARRQKAHSTEPQDARSIEDRCDPPGTQSFPNLSIAEENVHMGSGVLPKRFGLS